MCEAKNAKSCGRCWKHGSRTCPDVLLTPRMPSKEATGKFHGPLLRNSLGAHRFQRAGLQSKSMPVKSGTLEAMRTQARFSLLLPSRSLRHERLLRKKTYTSHSYRWRVDSNSSIFRELSA